MSKPDGKESENQKKKAGAKRPAQPDTRHLITPPPKAGGKNKPSGKSSEKREVHPASDQASKDPASHARSEVYPAKPVPKPKSAKPGPLTTARETLSGFVNKAVNTAESYGLRLTPESRSANRAGDTKPSKPSAPPKPDSKPATSSMPAETTKSKEPPSLTRSSTQASRPEAPAPLTEEQQQRAALIKETLNTSPANAEKLVRRMNRDEERKFDRVADSDNPDLRKRGIEAITNLEARRLSSETRAQRPEPHQPEAKRKISDERQPQHDTRLVAPSNTPADKAPLRTTTTELLPALTPEQQKRAAVIKQTLNTNDDNAEKLVRRMNKDEERRFDRAADTPDQDLRKRALESITNSEARRLSNEARQQSAPDKRDSATTTTAGTNIDNQRGRDQFLSGKIATEQNRDFFAPPESRPSTPASRPETAPLTKEQQQRAEIIKQNLNTGDTATTKLVQRMTPEEQKKFDEIAAISNPEQRKTAIEDAMNAQARRLSHEARTQANDLPAQSNTSSTTAGAERNQDRSPSFMSGKQGAEENKGFFAAPESRSQAGGRQASPEAPRTSNSDGAAATARELAGQTGSRSTPSDRSAGSTAGTSLGATVGAQAEKLAPGTQRPATADTGTRNPAGTSSPAGIDAPGKTGSAAARNADNLQTPGSTSKQFEKSDSAPVKTNATTTPSDTRPLTAPAGGKSSTATPAADSPAARTTSPSSKPDAPQTTSTDRYAGRTPPAETNVTRAPGTGNRPDAVQPLTPAARINRSAADAGTSSSPDKSTNTAADGIRTNLPNQSSIPGKDPEPIRRTFGPVEPYFNKSLAESRDFSWRLFQKDKEEKEKEEERKRREWYRLGGIPGSAPDKPADIAGQRPADRLRSDLNKMAADPAAALVLPSRSLRDTGDFGRRSDLNLARGLTPGDTQSRTFTSGPLPERNQLPGANQAQLAGILRNHAETAGRTPATSGRNPDSPSARPTDTTGGERSAATGSRNIADGRAGTFTNQPGRIVPDSRQPARTPIDTPGSRRPGDIAAGTRTTGAPGIPGIPGLSPGDIGRSIARSPGEKREFTGAEIALAAIIAAAGTARVRADSKTAPTADGDKKGSKANPLDAASIKKTDAALRQPLKGGDARIASEVANAANQPEELPETSEDVLAAEPIESPIGYLPEFHIVGDAISLVKKLNPISLLKPEESVSRSTDPSTDSQDTTTSGVSSVLTRPTFLVSEEYTLVSLAEELFHDPNVGWLIADLNKESVKETYVNGKRVIELLSRQEIILPVWQDIVDFYQHRPADALPENLVTIVSQSGVDRELLDSSLSVAMGANSSVFPALPAPTKPAFKPLLSRSLSLPANKVPTLAWLTRAGYSLQTFVSKTTEPRPTFHNLHNTQDFPEPPATPAGS